MSNASPSRLVNGDKNNIGVSTASVIGVVGLDYQELFDDEETVTVQSSSSRELRSGGIAAATGDYREIVITSVACTGTPGAVVSTTAAARAAYNMVAAMNEHLSSSSTTNSARTSAVQNHEYQSPTETSKSAAAGGILSFPCDFDHMYASMTDGGTPAAATATSALGVSPLRGNEARHNDLTEVKHLKELLLLHLDLIQQQSEQIVTKDKLLAALRQENETVGNIATCAA